MEPTAQDRIDSSGVILTGIFEMTLAWPEESSYANHRHTNQGRQTHGTFDR
jgi:hypothetical protein